MANDFTKILELANKNNMGLSNTIKRDYGIPLDYSSVQESYEAALAYAQSSTLAYIGQPISVGDTLYIVTDEANGYLKAVGTKPSGDNKSIEVSDEGIISISGFAAAEGATLPKKQADGSIKWVAVSAIVEGDGNTKTVVKAADDSAITVTPEYDETDDTYTYTLDVTLPAIPAYGITKDTSVDGQVTYQFTKDGVAEGDAIVVPNAYDDKALSGRVATLETNGAAQATDIEALKTGKADTEHVHEISDITDLQEVLDGKEASGAEARAKAYTDTEIAGLDVVIAQGDGDDTNTYIKIVDNNGTEISKVDASVFVKDSFLDDVAYDSATGKVTFTWKMNDGSTKTDDINISHLVDTYTAGTGIIVENNVISVDDTIATKQDIADLAIEDYAKSNDVVSNAAFADFQEANTASIEAAKQEAIEVAKKAEEEKKYATETVVDEKISNAITAHEAAANAKYLVDSDLADIRASITDIDNTLATKADSDDLNSYYTKSETYTQTEINNLLEGIQAGSSESAASVKTQLDSYKSTNDERVEAIEIENDAQDTAIADNAAAIAILNKTDGTEGSVKKTVDDAVKVLLDGQVTTNKNDIVTLTTQVNTIDGNITDINTEIVALKQKDTELATNISNEVAAREALAELVSENIIDIENLEKKDTELASLIQANTDKFENYATTTEMSEAIAAAINDISADIENNSEAIAEETARAKAAESANKALIDKLIGEDSDKSAREIAKEEVAAIVDSAPEAFDTLKEVADWIGTEESGAAAMSAAIAENKAAIAVLNGDAEGSVNKKITDAIKAIPVATDAIAGIVKASDEIAVATDGKMSITKVSTDILVQGNEELVLNGGTAK